MNVSPFPNANTGTTQPITTSAKMPYFRSDDPSRASTQLDGERQAMDKANASWAETVAGQVQQPTPNQPLGPPYMYWTGDPRMPYQTRAAPGGPTITMPAGGQEPTLESQTELLRILEGLGAETYHAHRTQAEYDRLRAELHRLYGRVETHHNREAQKAGVSRMTMAAGASATRNWAAETAHPPQGRPQEEPSWTAQARNDAGSYGATHNAPGAGTGTQPWPCLQPSWNRSTGGVPFGNGGHQGGPRPAYTGGEDMGRFDPRRLVILKCTAMRRTSRRSWMHCSEVLDIAKPN